MTHSVQVLMASIYDLCTSKLHAQTVMSCGTNCSRVADCDFVAHPFRGLPLSLTDAEIEAPQSRLP